MFIYTVQYTYSTVHSQCHTAERPRFKEGNHADKKKIWKLWKIKEYGKKNLVKYKKNGKNHDNWNKKIKIQIQLKGVAN